MRTAFPRSASVLECQREWAAKDSYDAVMDIVKSDRGAYGIGVDHANTMVYVCHCGGYDRGRRTRASHS